MKMSKKNKIHLISYTNSSAVVFSLLSQIWIEPKSHLKPIFPGGKRKIDELGEIVKHFDSRSADERR